MSLYIKQGTYTGNGGATQAITGIGFSPKVLFIFGDYTSTANSSIAQWATVTQQTDDEGYAMNLTYSDTAYRHASIASLDADGFTAKVDYKNVNGVNYYYLALAGTDVVEGKYTGDGSDNRNITGIGFTPEWVVTQAIANLVFPYQKSSITGISTDISAPFSATGDGTNRIQNLNSDGFQLGTSTSVNADGYVYYYVAIKGNAYQFKSGQYTGNGSDNRDITGVGFTPVCVLIKSATTKAMSGKVTSLADDASFSTLRSTAVATNKIQSFSADGFQVGTNATVNADTIVFTYLAFSEDQPPVVTQANASLLYALV